MRASISASRPRAGRARCGVYDCAACDLLLAGRCLGCARGNLRLLRAGESPCAVYACARSLKLSGCHECQQTPCRLSPWRQAVCPLRGRAGERASYQEFRQALTSAQGAAAGGMGRLSRGAMKRLPAYLAAVDDYLRRGLQIVSSHHLARAVGVRAGLVRRDLAALGQFGTPGRGYELCRLDEGLRAALNLGPVRGAVWLGAAWLARQEGVSQALRQLGCRLVAVCDDQEAGGTTAGLRVRPLAQAASAARVCGAVVAVVADREAAMSGLVGALARAGVKGVLNLTEVPLPASGQVVIEQADLRTQLMRLLSQLAPATAEKRDGDDTSI